MKEAVITILKQIKAGLASFSGYLKRLIKASCAHALSIVLVLNVAQASIIPPDNSLSLNSESDINATSVADASFIGAKRKVSVVITAYSSTPDQTDDTPFITATGEHVADGIVAANFLPFNTKLLIPKYFGNKIFVVKDRMHPRFSDRVDIWFPTRSEADNFGLRKTEIVVL